MGKHKRFQINQTKYLLQSEFFDLKRQLLSPAVSKLDLRNKLAMRLAVSTGPRASELLVIRKQDLNKSDQSVFIRALKGGTDREMPLSRKLFFDLWRYANLIDTEHLFPIGYHQLRNTWEFYRPVKKKFHCLRHTFAIRLYKATLDIRLVQVALGHRSIQNTMVYAEYHYSREELKRVKVVAI